jgi:ABC-type iron transport system FetAB ATPase subunit
VHARQSVSGYALRCPPADADVTKLSGGERNRVHLAMLIRSGGNLLLLDQRIFTPLFRDTRFPSCLSRASRPG